MCTSTGYGEQTISKNRRQDITVAKVAQLVEHNLAKVRVAGSNPVFRSKSFYSGLGVPYQVSRTKGIIRLIYRMTLIFGGIAQLARAPALHAGGRGFESLYLHKN